MPREGWSGSVHSAQKLSLGLKQTILVQIFRPSFTSLERVYRFASGARVAGNPRSAFRSLVAIVPLLGALAILPRGHAQQPFATDDADVAEYRRWHFETNSEYDFLPHSLYPNLRQFTETIKFSYGLIRHCEVGMDFPLINIFNSSGSGLGNPFGLGDTDYSIKYNFLQER